MSTRLPSHKEISQLLNRSERPLHARAIAEACRIPNAQVSRLCSLLDDLAERGLLRRLSGQRYALAQPSENRESWEGVLSVNPRGFGFVGAAGHESVYVAPGALAGAIHGDRVRMSILARTERGSEGRIEAVTARRNPRVPGILRKRGKSTWLEPDDTRIRGPIVLGPSRDGKDGDAAVAEIRRFPDFPNENPEGELLVVLGRPGDPKVEVAKILLREQVRETHTDAALEEAERIVQQLTQAGTSGRTDLRRVPLPTIDPEDARDHDDAIWVERTRSGYRAWIAIADVSEYVRLGTELDREALGRGCTIYLPDRAIPMLPKALAADRCSLLPEQDRLCLCVIAELDRQGGVQKFEIVEGVMRSQARLTYEGVARALGWTTEGNPNPVAEAFAKPLVAMAELTEKLRKARFARGALELTLPEARVVLDPESGAPLNVVRRGSDPGVKRAYNVVEELMLLANELVARFLSEKKIPAIFRIHGTPDPDKLTRLGEVAERLGVVFEAERMLEPKGVSQFLTRIARHPKAQVLTQLLLRSLQQAVYDVNNIGHFGLASECYVHFTSPIRRYPDLVIHRLVKSVLRGEKVDKSPAGHEHMALLAAETSRRERAAMDIEREVVDLNRALLMQNHVGDNYEGTVTALVGSGVYVSLDEPFVDVLVRFESMGPDQYQLSEDELSIVGERSGDSINLGDRIRVQIEDVQVLRRSVYGKRLPPESSSLAEQQPSAKPQARKTRTPPAPRRPAKAAARGHSQKTAKRKAPSRKIPSRKRQK